MNEQERYQLGYNLMAEIGSILYKQNSSFIPDIDNISDKEYLSMEKDAEAIIPYYCMDDNWDDYRLNSIQKAIFAYSKNDIMLYVILQQLCRQWQVSQEMLEYIPQSFTALNTNYETTEVQVFPKLRTVFERIDPQKRMLDHFQLIHHDQLHDYYPVHHILPASNILPSQKTLRIAYSPIGNYNALEINHDISVDKNGLQRNIINVSVKKEVEARLCQEFQAAVQIACYEGADIFFGPEMITPASCVTLERNPFTGENINRWLQETLQGCPEKKPCLYILSNWDKQKNIAFIFDDYGQLIAGQNKHFPYVDKKHHFKENLLPSDKQIHILHLPPIGRLCVMICADFLEPQYRNLVAKLFEPSLILVPSCSKGIHDFVTASAAELYLGAQTIYGNTCTSLHFFDRPRTNHLEPVGCFTYAPTRKVVVKHMEAPFDKCDGCQSKTNPCLFIVDIPLFERNAGSTELPTVHTYSEKN